MDNPVTERLMSFFSYVVSGLLTLAGWSAQDWYGLVGAVCAVLTLVTLRKYKRMNYELRLREVELKERQTVVNAVGSSDD